MFGGEDDDDGDDETGGHTRYPVMPSLVAMQQMKNRLHLAYLGKKLMKWTAMATGKELRRLAYDMNTHYDDYGQLVAQAFLLLARARYFFPKMNVQVLNHVGDNAAVKVQFDKRSITGVKVLDMNIVDEGFDPYAHLGMGLGGTVILDAKIAWKNLLRLMIMMLQEKSTFSALDEANKNATKRQNVLAKVVVPRIIDTIKYVAQELEEKEREEFFRLTKIRDIKNKVREQAQKLRDGGKKPKPEPVEEFTPRRVPPPPEPKLEPEPEGPCPVCADYLETVEYMKKKKAWESNLKNLQKEIFAVINATKEAEKKGVNTGEFLKEASGLASLLEKTMSSAEEMPPRKPCTCQNAPIPVLPPPPPPKPLPPPPPPPPPPSKSPCGSECTCHDVKPVKEPPPPPPPPPAPEPCPICQPNITKLEEAQPRTPELKSPKESIKSVQSPCSSVCQKYDLELGTPKPKEAPPPPPPPPKPPASTPPLAPPKASAHGPCDCLKAKLVTASPLPPSPPPAPKPCPVCAPEPKPPAPKPCPVCAPEPKPIPPQTPPAPKPKEGPCAVCKSKPSAPPIASLPPAPKPKEGPCAVCKSKPSAPPIAPLPPAPKPKEGPCAVCKSKPSAPPIAPLPPAPKPKEGPCAVCKSKPSAPPIAPLPPLPPPPPKPKEEPCAVCKSKGSPTPPPPAKSPCAVCQSKKTPPPPTKSPCAVCQSQPAQPPCEPLPKPPAPCPVCQPAAKIPTPSQKSLSPHPSCASTCRHVEPLPPPTPIQRYKSPTPSQKSTAKSPTPSTYRAWDKKKKPAAEKKRVKVDEDSRSRTRSADSKDSVDSEAFQTDDELGTYETQTNTTTKILRTIDDEGVVSEEKKIIKIKRIIRTRNPNLSTNPSEQSHRSGYSSSNQSSGRSTPTCGSRNAKCCEMLTLKYPFLERAVSKTYSEIACRSPSLADPNIRSCISFTSAYILNDNSADDLCLEMLQERVVSYNGKNINYLDSRSLTYSEEELITRANEAIFEYDPKSKSLHDLQKLQNAATKCKSLNITYCTKPLIPS